jgi:hypothetical protein
MFENVHILNISFKFLLKVRKEFYKIISFETKYEK